MIQALGGPVHASIDLRRQGGALSSRASYSVFYVDTSKKPMRVNGCANDDEAKAELTRQLGGTGLTLQLFADNGIRALACYHGGAEWRRVFPPLGRGN